MNGTGSSVLELEEGLCPPYCPYEDIDRGEPADYRQQAALSAIAFLRRRHGAIDLDQTHVLEELSKLTSHGLRWRRVDSARQQLGRAKQSRPRLIRADAVSNAGATPLLGFIADQKQSEDLERVEDDRPEDLYRLWVSGIPGLSVEQTRRVITVMAEIQCLKSEAPGLVPQHLRQRVSRLRRETGLTLDTSLL